MITWIKNTPTKPKNKKRFEDLERGETFWCIPWIDEVVLQKILPIGEYNAISIASYNGNIDGNMQSIPPNREVVVRQLEIRKKGG